MMKEKPLPTNENQNENCCRTGDFIGAMASRRLIHPMT
jgi:hypothetical protein